MAGFSRSCSLLRRSLCSIKPGKCVSRSLSSQLTNFLESNSEKFSGNIDVKFQDSKVQDVLYRIIERNIDLNKVFSPRKESLEVPSYSLMTDEEFLEAEKAIKNEAKKRLKMPPVMTERKDIDMVLKKDPEIDGHDESDFVFTDISTTATNRNRRIVVREPNGTLREASWQERERMNFIYFQREGQTYELQPMLTDEHLPVVFEQMRHVDVLDLVCLQCAPDSPDYIRVHRRTYDDIDNRRAFYVLESSQYHGGMVFYFVSNKRIRGLLLHMVKDERIDDAIDVVKLHHIIHPDTELANDAKTRNLDGKDLLIAYAQDEGLDDLISLLIDDSMQLSKG